MNVRGIKRVKCVCTTGRHVAEEGGEGRQFILLHRLQGRAYPGVLSWSVRFSLHRVERA